MSPEKTIFEIDCRVISNNKISKRIYLLWLEVPPIARFIHPGQFINIDTGEEGVFFRRPFSIAAVRENSIAVLYKVVGKGTEAMSNWETGKTANIVGPLGNRFPLPENKSISSVLVAGGVGAAPLIFLNDVLFNNDFPVVMYIGARTAGEHFPVINKGPEPIVSTDDGTLGRKGNIVEILKEDLPLLPKPMVVYSCGPEAMIKSLTKLTSEANILHFTALEKLMACGLGICQGCVVETHKNNTDSRFKLVCKDGPVFNANELKQ